MQEQARATRKVITNTYLNMAAPVTAIVLTYCNEIEAAACLESLCASTYEALTVLLVDNLSPDGSGERLRARFPDIAYLQATTNGGYTAGNNRGMEWALAHGAEYVLVLNDDTELNADCVSKLVEAAQQTGAAVVAPQILYYDEPDTVWYAGGTFSPSRAMATHIGEDGPIDPTQQRMPVTFVCGCCFLIRASVLREVGGFDESYFTYVEDLELSVRLARAGHTLLYEPSARVFHRIGRAAPPTPRQILLRDTNRRRMVARHYTRFERARFALWFYPTRLIHLLRYIAARDWPKTRAIVQGATRPVRDLGHTSFASL
jgi:GT2 family glycosyltransferase